MLSVSYLRTLPFLVSTLFFLLSLLPAESRAQNQSKIEMGLFWVQLSSVELRRPSNVGTVAKSDMHSPQHQNNTV
jgi:hypothetical protein